MKLPLTCGALLVAAAFCLPAALKVKLTSGNADVTARPGYFVANPLPSR